jgi:ABC-type transport system involved in cytochrome c biogenesis permease subunit
MEAAALHPWTAATYLAASIAAVAGLSVRVRRALVVGVWLLAVAVVLHGLAFFELHGREPTPALTELPLAVSLASWLLVLSFLVLQLRVPGRGLAVLVAPAAFLGTVFAAFSASAPAAPEPSTASSALWSHLHVLLASGGLALLGVAGAAGVLYLVHHRAIKRHRVTRHSALPSLEALDRVNALGLALGFLLLTLGVVTGSLWVQTSEGRLWPGGLHANTTLGVWCVYALLLLQRFGTDESARRAALGSAVGFALLMLVVVGIGALR